MTTDQSLAEIARLRTDLEITRDVLAQTQRALDAERVARGMAEGDNVALVLQAREALFAWDRNAPLEIAMGTLADALVADHPGAQLLAELEAARKVVSAMRQIDRHVIGACASDFGDMPVPCDECGEMREIASQALTAYDAAREGRS